MDIQQPVQQQPPSVQPVPVVTRPPQNSWKIIILAVVGILVLGGASYGAYYYYWQTKNKQNEPIVCTQEAKLCSDGSSVGRTGPNCEFAECPIDPTANWQVYKNDKYGFEVKYPTNWIIEGDMFKPQTKRIPEDISIRVNAWKRNLALPYEFIPPTAAAIPVSGNKLEEYKVKVGDNMFYYGMGQFEGDWDITYEILNSKQSEIVSFDLKISGGRQRMDYYLPESEVRPELQIFNQILSTFKFTAQ